MSSKSRYKKKKKKKMQHIFASRGRNKKKKNRGAENGKVKGKEKTMEAIRFSSGLLPLDGRYTLGSNDCRYCESPWAAIVTF